MTATPYRRRQGDFELRILRDGRLVLVAPDETLMEIGEQCSSRPGIAPRGPATPNTTAFEGNTDPERQHLESENAEAASPDSS